MPDALPLTSSEVALVFAPALLAYAALTAMTVASWDPRARGAALGPRWRALAWGALVLMTLHVALIWALRYGFDPARATRNGWSGFLTFHAAWLAASLVLWRDWRADTRARLALLAIWLLVTSGAAPAPFRYPIVRPLAPIVLAIAGAGAVALGAHWWRARRARRQPLT
ncbi:MAG: hypothetical protein IT385_05590 [Deltaproteobacteria bacterium]|nr:hypothetical protein [Deltaproteobacteria bacterium]